MHVLIEGPDEVRNEGVVCRLLATRFKKRVTCNLSAGADDLALEWEGLMARFAKEIFVSDALEKHRQFWTDLLRSVLPDMIVLLDRHDKEWNDRVRQGYLTFADICNLKGESGYWDKRKELSETVHAELRAKKILLPPVRIIDTSGFSADQIYRSVLRMFDVFAPSLRQ